PWPCATAAACVWSRSSRHVRRPQENAPADLHILGNYTPSIHEVPMDIVVRGKNRSVPVRLRVTTRDKVAKIARFTHDAGRAEVDFSEVHTARIDGRQLCEITVHLKRRFLKAHAAAAEPESALDLAIDKVGHQVARVKDKRVSRTHGRRSGTSNGADSSDGEA